MSIIQLSGGERHTFALSALRIQLTGSTTQATLQALDQAGGEAVDVRLSPTEIVMTPQPRRVRLVAVPSSGGAFAGGTVIGLTLFTEGVSSLNEQVLVARQDAGALTSYEIGVLEFAADRSVLTVSGVGNVLPQAPQEGSGFVSSTLYDSPPAASRTSAPAPTPTGAAPNERDHAWLQAGRYALRDAAQLRPGQAPDSTDWGVVVDGSISMLQLELEGTLGQLLELTCGTLVSWTGTWPQVCLLAGSGVVEVSTAVMKPTDLGRTLLDAQPWSASLLRGAASALARRLRPGGTVVIVTDGVPGDVAELAALAEEMVDRSFRLVTTGVSAWGLSSDNEGRAWWQEELGGLDRFARLPNVEVVAVRTDAAGRLVLDGSRAAELAARLTSLGAAS